MEEPDILVEELQAVPVEGVIRVLQRVHLHPEGRPGDDVHSVVAAQPANHTNEHAVRGTNRMIREVGGGAEREGEREGGVWGGGRQRYRENETEKQRQRQRDRSRGRDRDRERHIETERQTQTHSHRDRRVKTDRDT